MTLHMPNWQLSLPRVLSFIRVESALSGEGIGAIAYKQGHKEEQGR
jgi:hypothetical protein